MEWVIAYQISTIGVNDWGLDDLIMQSFTVCSDIQCITWEKSYLGRLRPIYIFWYFGIHIHCTYVSLCEEKHHSRIHTKVHVQLTIFFICIHPMKYLYQINTHHKSRSRFHKQYCRVHTGMRGRYVTKQTHIAIFSFVPLFTKHIV